MATDNKRPYVEFVGNLLDYWNKLTTSEQDTVNGLLKKQEEKENWSSEFADAQLGSDFDSDYNTGMLGAEADWDELYDNSLDTQDKLDIKGFREDRTQPDHTLDQVAEERYDTKMDDARENYLSNQHSAESSGMTDNAFGSKKSGMSPVQQQAMVGLLKDFMSKAPDDPAPQIRGAGIIKGGGTPFPSLLAKKPERPRYVNKGLL